jgi:hypothetical protein
VLIEIKFWCGDLAILSRSRAHGGNLPVTIQMD